MEQVNHPKHYNQHPAGIECIDIIRHYTCDIANALKYLWRAGLKGEIGKEAAEKEIEDLEKALWYIEDYHKHFTERMAQATVCASKAQYGAYFKQLTGYDIKDVYRGYPSPVRDAIENLLMDVCYDDWRHPEESQCHNICRLHGAANNQYYREVGVAKYSPTHGTVEVVDEMKELMLINEDDE